jgi:hypothetical protein
MDPRLRVTKVSTWATAMSLKLHKIQSTTDAEVAFGIVDKGRDLLEGDTVFLVSEKNYSLAMLLEYNIVKVDDGDSLIVKPRFPMVPVSSVDIFTVLYELVNELADEDKWFKPSVVKVVLRWTFSETNRLHAIVLNQSPVFDLSKIEVVPRAPRAPRAAPCGGAPGGAHGDGRGGGPDRGHEDHGGLGGDDGLSTDDAPPPDADASASEVDVFDEAFLDAVAFALTERKYGLGSDEAEDHAPAWAAADAAQSGEALVSRNERAKVAKAAKAGSISVAKVAALAEASPTGPTEEAFAEAALQEALQVGGGEPEDEEQDPGVLGRCLGTPLCTLMNTSLRYVIQSAR